MDDHIVHIVTRILANEADAKDMLDFNDWMSRDEQNRHKFGQLMDYWNMSVKIENADTPEASFERFSRRMTPFGAMKKLLRTWALPVAASFALLIVGSLMMYLFMKSPTVEHYTYFSRNGDDHLTLPDQTTVHLNKNSRITYSSEYGRKKKNRQVELLGEAYFDVVKNRGTFRVGIANSDAVIEVLGTKFNVKAYEDEKEIVATLVEGSIMFRDGKQEVTMSPDQQLTYHKATSSFHLDETDVDLYISWKDRIYRYSRVPLQELCGELERIYGVEITLSPKFRDVSVSGSFEYEQSIDEVMEVMKKSVSFKWRREGTKIIIKE